MTAADHTPGPWTYDFSPEPGHASEFMVVGPGNAVLAYVGADEARDVVGPTVEANARLMAAAPELLTALKVIYATCVERAANDARGDWDGLAFEAEQAIARVEGRLE